jgi:hypothetical protein
MTPSEALLDFGKPVAYYPSLAKRLGSVNAALFFCQLFFLKGKEHFSGLGIYKSAAEMQEETGLTPDEQRTARKHLRDRGVLVETEKRLEHRIYYLINLKAFDDLKVPAPEVGNSHSGSGESNSGGTGTSRPLRQREQQEKTSEKTAKFSLPDWVDRELWDAYEEMRVKIKKPMTDTARKLALDKLKKLEAEGHTSDVVLRHSILNCYQGLFAPSSSTNGFREPSAPKLRETEFKR